MNRFLSVGLLVAGIILLAWGLNAFHSLSSSTVQAVTGAPSDKTIWLITAGIILTIGGAAGCIIPRRLEK
mgnify:CR=1 FL=1